MPDDAHFKRCHCKSFCSVCFLLIIGSPQYFAGVMPIAPDIQSGNTFFAHLQPCKKGKTM
jgi:hypothetical protein